MGGSRGPLSTAHAGGAVRRDQRRGAASRRGGGGGAPAARARSPSGQDDCEDGDLLAASLELLLTLSMGRCAWNSRRAQIHQITRRCAFWCHRTSRTRCYASTLTSFHRRASGSRPRRASSSAAALSIARFGLHRGRACNLDRGRRQARSAPEEHVITPARSADTSISFADDTALGPKERASRSASCRCCRRRVVGGG